VALPVNRPFGVLRDDAYRAAQLELQPGDRLVMLTDGMLERGAAALDLQARMQHLSDLHPREVVSVLADLVVDIAGPILRDDACMLVLDWLGADPDRPAPPTTERPTRTTHPDRVRLIPDLRFTARTPTSKSHRTMARTRPGQPHC
jgi:Stage II sporulation protein E (SpoIIE)